MFAPETECPCLFDESRKPKFPVAKRHNSYTLRELQWRIAVVRS